MARRPKKPKRPPRISGTILIVLGVLMLLANRMDIEKAWPLAIILAGVLMIVGWAVSDRKQADESRLPPSQSPPPPPPPVNG